MPPQGERAGSGQSASYFRRAVSSVRVLYAKVTASIACGVVASTRHGPYDGQDEICASVRNNCAGPGHVATRGTFAAIGSRCRSRTVASSSFISCSNAAHRMPPGRQVAASPLVDWQGPRRSQAHRTPLPPGKVRAEFATCAATPHEPEIAGIGSPVPWRSPRSAKSSAGGHIWKRTCTLGSSLPRLLSAPGTAVRSRRIPLTLTNTLEATRVLRRLDEYCAGCGVTIRCRLENPTIA